MYIVTHNNLGRCLSVSHLCSKHQIVLSYLSLKGSFDFLWTSIPISSILTRRGRQQMLSPNIVNIDVQCTLTSILQNSSRRKQNNFIGTECSAPPAKWVQDCLWLGRATIAKKRLPWGHFRVTIDYHKSNYRLP